MIGRNLGPYKIVDIIGQGGMGVVYKAEDVRLNRMVAIKVLASHLAERPKYVARFRREAQAAAKLNHPHIIAVYDVGLSAQGDRKAGVPYIVMEYVKGKSLAEILKKEGKLPLPQALEVGISVSDALAEAHDKGIVHRDIKPGNIMVAEDGTVKVTDFGLAKETDLSLTLKTCLSDLTGTGAVVGTVSYLSPEQISEGKADPRSDLYALGVVLYEVLTGGPPFLGNSVTSVLYKHLNEEPVPLREIVPDIPSEIQAIVLTLLNKPPEKRYESAAELASDLRKVGEELTEPESVPARERTIREAPAPFRSPLIGRDRNLTDLNARLDRAIGGEGGLVLLSGEAGIGKTRLAQELREYGKSRNVQFLIGECIYNEGTDPYLPFGEVLRACFGIDRSDSDVLKTRKIKKTLEKNVPDPSASLRTGLTDVESTVESFLVKGGVPASTAEERVARQSQLFWAILQTLVQGSTKRPLGFLIEDLHWADRATLELLDYVARGIRGHRILMVGTYRPEDLLKEEGPHPLKVRMRLMSREELYEEIVLDRLSREAMGEIARNLFEGIRLPEGFLERLFRETGGNPFFLIESLKLMRDEEVIRREGDGWILAAEHDRAGYEAAFHLPSRVYDVIMRRIERLSEGDRSLLQCAAVEGEVFSSDILSHVLSAGRMEVLRTLGRLERAHQIIRSEGVRYRFDHPQIREVLYEELSNEMKSALHLSIAEFKEHTHRDDPEPVLYDLAYHFSRSEDVEKAIAYLVRAGDKARSLHADREAIVYFERASELLNTIPSDDREEQRVSVNETLGDLHLLVAEPDLALDRYGKALTHVQDRRKRADLKRKMGVGQNRRGDINAASEHLQAALEELEEDHGSVERARVLLDLADLHNSPSFSGFDPTRSLALCREALEMLEGTEHDSELARAYASLSMHHAMEGDLEQTLTYWKKSLEVSERTDDRAEMAQTHGFFGHCMAHYFADVDRAIQSFEESLRIQETIGNIHVLALTHWTLGEQYTKKGELDRASRHLERSLKIAKEFATPQLISRCEQALGDVRSIQGRTDEAIAHYRAGTEEAVRYGYTLPLAGLLGKFEEACTVSGRVEEFGTFCRDLWTRRRSEVEGLPLKRWWGEPGEPAARFATIGFEDRFDAPSVEAGWTWIAPRGRCSYRLLSGRGLLEIAPRLGVGLLANVDAPRMMREVCGEFAVETRMVPGPGACRGAGGLLVWKGPDRFVRFESGVLTPDKITLCSRSEAGFLAVGRGRLDAPELCLRIERTGTGSPRGTATASAGGTAGRRSYLRRIRSTSACMPNVRIPWIGLRRLCRCTTTDSGS